MSGSHSALTSTERPTGVQFEQYVADSRQRLFRFAVVLSGDTVLAGDLVADVLGKVFERWPQVSAADNVHAYVRRMLVNEFVSWQRRRARAAPHPEVGRLVDLQTHRTGTSVSDPAEPNAERSALLDDLSRLPARQRRDRPAVLRGPQRRRHRRSPRLPHRHGAQQHLARPRHLAHHHFTRQDDLMNRTEQDLRDALDELDRRAVEHGAPSVERILDRPPPSNR